MKAVCSIWAVLPRQRLLLAANLICAEEPNDLRCTKQQSCADGKKEGMSRWKALSTRVLLEKSLIIPSHTLEGKCQTQRWKCWVAARFTNAVWPRGL